MSTAEATPETVAESRLPKERQPLYALASSAPVRASYDSASVSAQIAPYWANADRLDADSANSRAVRERLVSRSRYAVGNDGFADGIATTYANDLVGIGPKLRMQTGSTGFNQLIEAEFARWTKAVQFRRKLWTMVHAKHVDGEGFAVVVRNPGARHPVKLDLRLIETEQCQTPLLAMMTGEVGYIDGIKFDEFGNPEYYDILRTHPGSALTWAIQVPERVPAKFVLQWFLMRRPGQHRGVPECASTLNLGEASRRWREATLAAAETAADFAALLKSDMPPGEAADPVAAMSSMEIRKRMMTALPMGWSMEQLDSKHPNATHDGFRKSLINEQARPKSMPYNKAACDSSSYNYASGRLDHQTYYGSLDVDREDGTDLVLDPLFDLWIRDAIVEFGWLGGDPDALSPAAFAHSWDWPKHQVADLGAEASANDTKLKHGELSLTRLYAQNGEDFEDEVAVMASDYGVSVEEMKQILLHAIFNAQNQQASMTQAATQSAATKPAKQEAPANA